MKKVEMEALEAVKEEKALEAVVAEVKEISEAEAKAEKAMEVAEIKADLAKKFEARKAEILSKLQERKRDLTISELIFFSQNIKGILPAQRRDDSHNPSMRSAIVMSALQGKPIGTITLAYATDIDTFYVMDGQSRLKDIQLALQGQVKGVELTLETRKALLNHNVSITWEEGEEAYLNMRFAEINNCKALSQLQKNRGMLAVNKSGLLTDLNRLSNHRLFTMCLSNANIVQEMPLAILQTVVALATNCYQSSNAKMVDAISKSETEIDIELLEDILNRTAVAVDDLEEKGCTKYNLIHFLHRMYMGTCVHKPLIGGGERSKNTKKFTDCTFDTSIIDTSFLEDTLCKAVFSTTGANSAPQNKIRCDKMENWVADVVFASMPAEEQAQTGVLDPDSLTA